MVQELDQDQAPLSEHIRIEPLGPHHDRAAFVCSKPHLTHYFNGTTSPPRTLDQDLKYYMARPFVMEDERTHEVLGYFTLCNQSISRGSFSKNIARKLGYPSIPTMLLGRMAIHSRLEGQGLGTDLLLAVLYTVYRLTDRGQGCYAVVLDAGDDELVKWYSNPKRGFVLVPTEEQPRRMVLPMSKIIEQIEKNEE